MSLIHFTPPRLTLDGGARNVGRYVASRPGRDRQWSRCAAGNHCMFTRMGMMNFSMCRCSIMLLVALLSCSKQNGALHTILRTADSSGREIGSRLYAGRR